MTSPPESLLEIACFNAESAVIAHKAGADRIEFCHGKDCGGTTPLLSCLLLVKKQITSIPVFVMIRPRGGDFVYSHAEFEQMKADIDAFRDLADGLVFGVMTAEGRVDVKRTTELVKRSHGLPCTFHRAFDETKDLSAGLEDVVKTGCRAILSSGGKRDARAGSHVLAGLVRQAQGRVEIIPGGGVRAANIRQLQEVTGAATFHSSGIPDGETEADGEEIGKMKALLRDETMVPVHQGSVRGSLSRHESSDGESTPAEMHASAVSVGELRAPGT